MNRWDRKYVALLGMILMGDVLRVWGLDAQSLWRDEVDTVRFATQPLPDLLAMFVTPGHNGPLYYLIMRPWILYFGHVDYALRYASVLVGLFAIPLTFQVLRRWIGDASAMLAAMLVAASPYVIWYAQELRMYAFVLVIVLAATWCWTEALWRGRPLFWLPYVGLISAGIYMHFLVALLIPTHVITSLLFPGLLRRGWRGWVAAYAAFALPYIPLAWWQEKLLFSPTFRTGHPFVPWPQMIYKLLTVFSVGVHVVPMPKPLPPNARLVPLVFLALAGLFIRGRCKGARVIARLALLLWFLLPVTGLYLISLELPLFTERYLIWTLPAVYGLAAIGARALPRAWGKPALALVLLLFVVGIGYQVHNPVKPDMRGATRYVEAAREDGDIVLLHLGYLIHSYLYYAPDARPHLREAPAPGLQGTLESTGADILRRVGNARDIWLVESESSMWDPRGLVRKWLEQNADVVEDRQFVGVRVTHFRLRQKMAVLPGAGRGGVCRCMLRRRAAPGNGWCDGPARAPG